MTLPGPDDDIRLTSHDIELIRGVLVTCSQLLRWAERWGDAQFRAGLHDAAQRAKGGRALGQLRYDVNLSIDYLDFAEPIRRRR
jgi:hypothetical protein